jgi:hypothetical protein
VVCSFCMSPSSKPFEARGISPLSCSGYFVSSWKIENFKEEEGAQNLKRIGPISSEL